MHDLISQRIREHKDLMEKATQYMQDAIGNLAAAMVRCLKQGGRILCCGNGGSAADAQHLACELVGTFMVKTRPALPAISLTTNTSSLTSIGNDFCFDDIFSRQVEALAKPGDLCIGISTSGNSENVYRALTAARKIGCATAALLGGTGGRIRELTDVAIVVPSPCTPRIQELHILAIHILCEIIDQTFTEGIGDKS
ncbi:MAG TPA: D-sedoheptulose 7-phosphate isomerase [Candidatus Sumerlaeota bacterium]|mgnify:FL=1|nr:D-sedoheptulose 7-phosphate isomerase [Candidatus Sumerlaeota bacterium]